MLQVAKAGLVIAFIAAVVAIFVVLPVVFGLSGPDGAFTPCMVLGVGCDAADGR